MSDAVRDTLRNLVVGDEQTIARTMGGGCLPSVDALDQRTVVLLRLAALIAVDGDRTSHQRVASAALAAGATPEQIVGVLVAVGSIIGSSRLMAGAERLAMPIGYDVDSDLEAMPAHPGWVDGRP